MAKKSRKSSQVNNPYVSQAEQYAVIRYGPQVSGLRTLLQNARSEYQRSVKNARQGAQAVQDAVAQASPLVDQAYADAGVRMQQRQSIVDQDLAQIGQPQGLSAALQQAIALERQGAADSMAREQAFSQSALQRRATDAVVASRAAITEAKDTRNLAVGQILQQATDLAGQRGAFIASTAQDLAGDAAAAQAKADAQAADRALRQYTAELQANTSIENNKRTNRTSRRNAAARAEADAIKAGQAADDKYLTKFGLTRDQFMGLPDDVKQRLAQSASSDGTTTEKTPTGVDLATPTQFGNFKDSVSAAQRAASVLKNRKLPRSKAAQVLLQGVPAYTDPKTGEKIPAIKPATKSALQAKIALDLVYDGRVSRGTRQEMWQRGFTLDKLGFKGPPSGPPASPAQKKLTRTVGSQLASLDELLRQLGN